MGRGEGSGKGAIISNPQNKQRKSLRLREVKGGKGERMNRGEVKVSGRKRGKEKKRGGKEGQT